MFGKLKNKLKNWARKVSKEKEGIIEKTKEKKKEILEEQKILKKKINGERIDEQLKKDAEKIKKVIHLEPSLDKQLKGGTIGNGIKYPFHGEEPKEKKSFFKKIISKERIISQEEFEKYSEDLEMILLENNVALEITEKIIKELKDKIVSKEINKKEIENLIINSLKEILEEVLISPFDILQEINKKKEPYIMVFCGINGVGKTTQIAKMAYLFKEKGISSVLAAADTFRAAAIEQLKKHGEKLNVKVITHEYGSDPASVGFDAIKYAKKNKIDVVLIDTAGRIHTATNLLREMQKIIKVTKPDRTIFVGESITGNDAVDQVKAFDEAIGIDGIFLSKADIDEKGGTALSIGYITKKPIIYLGTGQKYGDLEPFNKNKFIEKLGL